ncbi:MAG: hypothetical protein ACXVCH_17345, partial [Bdellovibrionota bacterium]
MKRLRFSIRMKIMALLGGALAVSLLSYLYAGTSLIVEDKVSYIYDFNLAQVRAAADAVEGQIQKVLSATRVIGNLAGSNAATSAT